MPVCYKPFMRKWVRERMKRRKASKESQPEASQTPLQPAYFDLKEPSKAEEAKPETPPESLPASLEAMEEATPSSPTQSAPQESSPRRRRRGRGGRGRSSGRSQQTVARPAAPPSAAESQTSAPETPSASSQVAEAPARKPKGIVVLAVGLPGSGKSSWFKRHNINALSSDMLRLLLFDDPTEQRFQDLVFSNLRSMLKARLIARRPINYVDATNLSTHDRQGWIKLARDFGYEVHAVYFDVPVEVCLERNQRRDRVVPEEAMRRMASKLRPPSFDEGFAKITVVRVKRKEGGPVE